MESKSALHHTSCKPAWIHTEGMSDSKMPPPTEKKEHHPKGLAGKSNPDHLPPATAVTQVKLNPDCPVTTDLSTSPEKSPTEIWKVISFSSASIVCLDSTENLCRKHQHENRMDKILRPNDTKTSALRSLQACHWTLQPLMTGNKTSEASRHCTFTVAPVLCFCIMPRFLTKISRRHGKSCRKAGEQNDEKLTRKKRPPHRERKHTA